MEQHKKIKYLAISLAVVIITIVVLNISKLLYVSDIEYLKHYDASYLIYNKDGAKVAEFSHEGHTYLIAYSFSASGGVSAPTHSESCKGIHDD